MSVVSQSETAEGLLKHKQNRREAGEERKSVEQDRENFKQTALETWVNLEKKARAGDFDSKEIDGKFDDSLYNLYQALGTSSKPGRKELVDGKIMKMVVKITPFLTTDYSEDYLEEIMSDHDWDDLARGVRALPPVLEVVRPPVKVIYGKNS